MQIFDLKFDIDVIFKFVSLFIFKARYNFIQKLIFYNHALITFNLKYVVHDKI